jgi:flagellar biosynthesis/type III secretory pathway chaperone
MSSSQSSVNRDKYHLIHNNKHAPKYYLLGKDNQWLLRESRYDGFLTVDYQKRGENKSIRFAYVDKKWEVVAEKEISKYQEKMTTINLIDDGIMDAVSQLFQLLAKNGFILDESFLAPQKTEATVNVLYTGYETTTVAYSQEKNGKSLSDSQERMIEELEKTINEFNEDCPITLSPVREKRVVALARNEKVLFSENALNKWVGSEKTDPTTRSPISKREIITTTIVGRLFNKLERIKQLRAKRNETKESELDDSQQLDEKPNKHLP